MWTHHSLHITLISILQGEIARLVFKWDFKSGKLSHFSLFINRIVVHNCSFLLKAAILSWSCRRWISFPWSEMFNWFNFVFCVRAPGGQIDRSWDLLSTNRSENTALVIMTPRSSTRSFANDLAPHRSNRRMHQLGSGPCPLRSDIGSSYSPTAV